jgi:hypothetical protein
MREPVGSDEKRNLDPIKGFGPGWVAALLGFVLIVGVIAWVAIAFSK